MNPSPLYRFYGVDVSYFSAKVRPALRYKQVPFAEVLTTPDVYRNVIMPRTGMAFIPILVTPDDETLQDTSDILDALDVRFPEPRLEPRTPVQRVVARIIELYADEFMVLPAMHYRWGTEEGERKARADFACFSGNPKTANAFADRMSGSLQALGVVPESTEIIEAHLGELLASFERHLEAEPYLLGGAPSLADCALMGPFYAHLYLDAVPGRLLRSEALGVCNWIERMNHPDPDGPPGPWAPDDTLPATLRPILELIGRDAVPVLLDSARNFDAWAKTRPAELEEPPRAVGFHETGFRGVRFSRYTSAYAVWMLQRVSDVVTALTPSERQSVDKALKGTGCEALFDPALETRLEKRGFKLAFASR